MSKPELHPWLSTPEALKAARDAVRIPFNRLPAAAARAAEELQSEALILLTECALPPRERVYTACAECGKSLSNVRAGAKFCSALCRKRVAARVRRGTDVVKPDEKRSHIGAMWSWPQDDIATYAVQEVGGQLCNFLRKRNLGQNEIPSSQWFENDDVLVSPSAEDAYLQNSATTALEYFELRGSLVSGSEVE